MMLSPARGEAAKRLAFDVSLRAVIAAAGAAREPGESSWQAVGGKAARGGYITVDAAQGASVVWVQSDGQVAELRHGECFAVGAAGDLRMAPHCADPCSLVRVVWSDLPVALPPLAHGARTMSFDLAASGDWVANSEYIFVPANTSVLLECRASAAAPEVRLTGIVDADPRVGGESSAFGTDGYWSVQMGAGESEALVMAGGDWPRAYRLAASQAARVRVRFGGA